MSIANGMLSLTCDKCGTQYDFPDSDAKFEVVEINNRPMGPDKQHSWNMQFTCNKCSNEIEFEYDVWEYPEGGFETDELAITGGNEIGRYTYDFQGGIE